MGAAVPKSLKTRNVKSFVGKQVLNIITSGMYDDPLMVIREFVQNSADAIDLKFGKNASSRGVISIEIDGKSRTMTITDNGCGISADQAEGRLADIGHSFKEGSELRGFRGIGRLGALAYCDLLRFETRAESEDEVTIVQWDGKKLRDMSKDTSKKNISLDEAVKEVASLSTREATKEDQPSFFTVKMINVNPFHKDELISIPRIREYLRQVAPAPIDPAEFTFAEKINNHLKDVSDYRSYNIFVNGTQIYRPFKDTFQISKDAQDQILDIVTFDFKDSKGKKVAVGWYAKTNFLAAIPRETLMRGIRVRKGNIEVGDENYLQNCFTETRFAAWHIGELHIASAGVEANARRDGFEQSSEFELFLERCNILGRHLSGLCRTSSKERSAARSVIQKLEQAERLLKTNHIFVSEEHREEFGSFLETIVENLRKDLENNESPELAKRFKTVEANYKKFLKGAQSLTEQLDGRALRRKENKELIAELCDTVRVLYKQNLTVEEFIKGMVEPYLK